MRTPTSCCFLPPSLTPSLRESMAWKPGRSEPSEQPKVILQRAEQGTSGWRTHLQEPTEISGPIGNFRRFQIGEPRVLCSSGSVIEPMAGLRTGKRPLATGLEREAEDVDEGSGSRGRKQGLELCCLQIGELLPYSHFSLQSVLERLSVF